MWTPDHVRERAGRKTVRLRTDEEPKNLKPRRLTKCRERRESMRCRHSVSALLWSYMADHSQRGFLHKKPMLHLIRTTAVNGRMTGIQDRTIVMSRILDELSLSRMTAV